MLGEGECVGGGGVGVGFFFFKQKTAYEIGTGDWSSDVCSSDLPDTLQQLATEWGDDGFRAYWRGGLKSLVSKLQDAESTAFTEQPADQRQLILSAHDAEVFDGAIEDGFYRDFKATVVQAYYMSEAGASEELAYEPVPGEFIGCVDLSDFPKTWAT